MKKWTPGIRLYIHREGASISWVFVPSHSVQSQPGPSQKTGVEQKEWESMSEAEKKRKVT